MGEKLVRDKIIEWSAAKKDGRRFRTISVAERLKFLSAKIYEETKEVQDAMYNGGPGQVAEELGDVLEVMEAICAWGGFTLEDVKTLQAIKRETKGSFNTFTVMELNNEVPDETW